MVKSIEKWQTGGVTFPVDGLFVVVSFVYSDLRLWICERLLCLALLLLQLCTHFYQNNGLDMKRKEEQSRIIHISWVVDLPPLIIFVFIPLFSMVDTWNLLAIGKSGYLGGGWASLQVKRDLGYRYELWKCSASASEGALCSHQGGPGTSKMTIPSTLRMAANAYSQTLFTQATSEDQSSVRCRGFLWF